LRIFVRCLRLQACTPASSPLFVGLHPYTKTGMVPTAAICGRWPTHQPRRITLNHREAVPRSSRLYRDDRVFGSRLVGRVGDHKCSYGRQASGCPTAGACI
jgi:hypothetical protein